MKAQLAICLVVSGCGGDDGGTESGGGTDSMGMTSAATTSGSMSASASGSGSASGSTQSSESDSATTEMDGSSSAATTATTTSGGSMGSSEDAGTMSSDSSSMCSNDMESCAQGQRCCVNLSCCEGQPVPPGEEYCSISCPDSDRNLKHEFATVDAHQILARVAALPLTTWTYKHDPAAARHLGPMAQDFKSAFELGASDRAIHKIDADGVALAAIQALHADLQATRAENAALRARLDALEARLEGPLGSP